MASTTLRLSHSTSRGRDTYGYNIVRLDDESTGKRYRCMGGGYDMVGSVVADWLQDVHQDALQGIAGQAHIVYNTPCSFGADGLPYVTNESGLYGMHVTGGGTVRVDGACGLRSVETIAEAAGVTISHAEWDRKGNTTSWVAAS